MFEAAGAGIAIFRRDGWIEGLGRASRVTVEVHEQMVVRQPTVRHEVFVLQIEQWLEGTTKSPE